MTRQSGFIIFSLLFLVSCPSARAELNFCNQTPLTIQTIVARPAEERKWRSSGWYVLTPGQCKMVVAGDLKNRYYYAYAETPGEKRAWEGKDAQFCIAPRPFVIVKQTCERSALRNFRAIDVADHRSFDYWFTCPDCVDPRLAAALQSHLPSLEKIANQAAPLWYKTADWIKAGQVDVQYGLSRAPFRLKLDGNQTLLSTPISYWLAVSRITLFGVRTGLGSCGVNAAELRAEAKLTTIFGVTPDGRFSSKTRASIDFPSPCRLTIFNVDATPRVREIAEPQLERAADAIDSQIREVDASRVLNVNKLY